MTTTAILVSATNDPLRVSGSDGVDHLEYDLLVTNGFAAPVTLTAIVVTTPDGQTIVFDHLGDLYTIPITGGKAMPLTRGMAVDAQPRFSPDGKRITFVSDRKGASNLWIMSLDLRDTVQITRGRTDSYDSPEFTPDGKYVIGSRGNNLFMFHVDGGSGVQIGAPPPATAAPAGGRGGGATATRYLGPAFGKDSRYMWVSRRSGGSQWEYNDPIGGAYDVAVYDRETGQFSMRATRWGSAFRPTLSPDGKWLASGSSDQTLRLWLLAGCDSQEELANLSHVTAEAFTGHRIVKAFGAERHEGQRFRTASYRLYRTNLKVTSSLAILPPLMELLGGVALAVAFVVTVSTLFFCSLAGFAFAKLRFAGRDRTFTMLVAALGIPAQVAMLPLFLLLKSLGLVNTYAGVLIPYIATIYGVFLVRQFMISIPDDLLAAAAQHPAPQHPLLHARPDLRRLDLPGVIRRHVHLRRAARHRDAAA